MAFVSSYLCTCLYMFVICECSDLAFVSAKFLFFPKLCAYKGGLATVLRCMVVCKFDIHIE